MVQTTQPPIVSYATWSPTGESIAFVSSNDVYVLPSPAPSTSPIRVTSSGNTSLFHGVPDWVYEEEVFESDYALWWSPDSTKLAFLRLDETYVDEYTFPIYNPTSDAAAVVPYPESVTMKYPKPGYNNPLVSVFVFELDRYQDAVLLGNDVAESNTVELTWNGRFPANRSIIFEVSWVGDTSLIVKEVNRAGDEGNVVLFDLQEDNVVTRANGTVIRTLGKNGEEGDNGWIESVCRVPSLYVLYAIFSHEIRQIQNIYPLPSSVSHQGTPGYLDIVPNHEGYNHIALFNPFDSGTPRFLTSGHWEVTGGILAVDVDRGLV
jgi:dipeptidyl aminopeptidase B